MPGRVMTTNLQAQVVPRRPTAAHTCGQVGKTTITRPKPTYFQGHPKEISLTRAERYWIQRRIEALGEAASPQELALLAKVALY